ncbi:hypothetical protein B0T25DRAFT_477217 [Lasiosphaeria hispida]|uniref:Heterokaryon incompatibility domain-containing protein n=1 Tax=Lasiosphaeria hispida TaxID=260671 RepID=A0AAJ0HNX0_9PEZI|nr:hypothetical protein B0T25DRAFT_477217 [Lasiosphaeria hispida]
MRLINVKTHKLEEFLDYKAPKYAILSHTWGDDAEELTSRDVEDGRIHKPGAGSTKFLGSCRQAVQDGLGYVWIDTCCIDKTNLVELSEAINSMFRWYQRASLCYAYLSDVPSGDKPKKPSSKFCTSRWFRRGWTLQELLAPQHLQFYNSEWGCLGTKGNLRNTVEKITGIPRQILLGITELQSASVAQRMSWAAGRETKRKEDLAYCLLGIFGATMPMIYGEGGDQAFLRLQDQILRTTRDDSILAWGLISPEQALLNNPDQTGQATAGRILATAPSDFTYSGDIVCREQSSTPSPLDISGGSLRLYLSLLTTSSGGVVGLLNCGPRHDPLRRVGIPLTQTASNEYVRPEGCHAALQPITASGTSPSLIHIRNDNTSKKSAEARQQYWLYDDDAFAEFNLDLVDVNPLPCWDRERAMIVSTLVLSGGATHQTLARFRHNDEESPDFVMLLEVKQQGASAEPKCHIMTCSRNTSLQELADRQQYVLQRSSGRDSASNGLVHLRVALESDTQQSVCTITPEVLSHPPDITINIAAELRKSVLMLEFAGIWEAKGQNDMERKELGQRVDDKHHQLERVKKEREVIQDELRKLEKRIRVLAEEQSNGAEEIRLLSERQAAVEARQEQAFRRWSHTRKRWDELYHTNLDNDGYDLEEMDDWMPIYWAAEKGYAEIVKLLLTKGAGLAVVNKCGRTPLMAASDKGHIDVVQLLVENGVDVDVEDKDARTALWYAREARHNAVVQLLQSGCKRRKKVAIVVSASGHIDDVDSDGYYEHAYFLSHIPKNIDFSKIKLYIIIYAPSLKDTTVATTSTIPPPSLSSSFSDINHAQDQTPGSEAKSPLAAPSTADLAYNAIYAQAQALVENDSMALTYTTPNGHAYILRHIQPETIYLQESLGGENGSVVTQLQTWLRHDLVLVVGDKSSYGGLANSESEAEEPVQEVWWHREDRVGRGRGVVVVDGLRVHDDWLRRIQGKE